MPNELTPFAKKINDAVDELRRQKTALSRENNSVRKQILEDRIFSIEKSIEAQSKNIYLSLKQVKKSPLLKKEVSIEEKKEVSNFESKTFKNLSKEEKNKFIQELNLGAEYVRIFVKEQKTGKKDEGLKKPDYSIYRPNQWGVVANKYAKKYADDFIMNYPNFFKPLLDNFERVDMPFLSRTYVSVMLFFSVLSFPAGLILLTILNFAFGLSWFIVGAIILLIPFMTFAVFYFYPTSLRGGIANKIRQELPFALVHMSAVAGSGAHPLSIFELLVNSKEYPELKKEFRKILNYVNLFGYNLTTSLNNVSKNTPSKELKELFNGMVSTIESGGDLKAYLNEKAIESLNHYKLDRRKKVEALATYSEIYTALLIAAPLLLIIALSIMNQVGGDLGGISLSTIAYASIGVVLPLLNVGFMLFIGASQK